MCVVLHVLLVGFLLHSGQCTNGFSVSLPKQKFEVLSGSCVTIPCSFQIPTDHDKNLNSECKGMWKNSRDEEKKNTKQTGTLTQKSCNTTFYDMTCQETGSYFFRLQCNNELKYNFKDSSVYILVKDAPPTLTLTPPTLNVREGESVTVQCSAPVLCPTLPPNLTLTPVLGDTQETSGQDVRMSTLSFTASQIHHETTITCSAVYRGIDGKPLYVVSAQLTANVTFAPQMKSSNCTGDSAQISCLCETEGNPIPIIQWHFSGLSAANHFISSEPLRSTITLVQPQWRDPVTLVCHSSNSLGSDSHRFNVSALEHVHGTSAEQQGLGVMTPVFMASIATLVVLVFVLLCVIRTLTVRLNKQQPPAEAMEELPENADADDSGANSNKQSDVYSNVNWKTKSNKKKVQEAAGDTEPSCSSYLEEQRSIVGENRQVVIGKDVECEYAQVKFKPKRATNQ